MLSLFMRAARPAGPVQGVTSRSVYDYHDFSVRPTADLKWDVFTYLSHGAQCTIVDKANYDGSCDPVVYDRIREIFGEARERLDDRQVLLGCARPPGMHKRVTDAYAIMAGLDGIAFPADGAVSVAHTIGRPFTQAHSCCSIKVGSDMSISVARSCAA